MLWLITVVLTIRSSVAEFVQRYANIVVAFARKLRDTAGKAEHNRQLYQNQCEPSTPFASVTKHL